MKLNGAANLGENIADNGGVKAAYYGYCEFILSALLPGEYSLVLKN